MNESSPIECAQCGEPIWLGGDKPYRMVTWEREGTDPVEEVHGAVHQDCWPAWAKAHGVGPD